jgi:murein DD-endopeptidase MepM/ murein hydrolase activator NlpD
MAAALGRAAVAALALLLLLGSSVPGARGDELADARAERRAIEAKIAQQEALARSIASSQQRLSGRIAATSAALEAAATDLDATKAEMRGLRSSLRDVRSRITDLAAEERRVEAELRQARKDEAAKRKALAERKALLAERIRASYDASRRSPFEALVTGASFTDLLNEMSLSLDAGEQDRVLAGQIVADRATLATMVQALELRERQVRELGQQVAVQRAELDAQLELLRRAERRLAKLQRDAASLLASQRSAYRDLARDKARARSVAAAAKRAQERLEDRIARLIEEQRSAGGIPSQFSGTMRWPMRGAISQEYGCTGFAWEPPRGDCAHFHNGIDIVAPAGTPVRAAAPGRVLFAGYNPYDDPRDPAWIVIIAHSDSVQTWYAHLQPRRPVAVGSLVHAGDVIGYEGSTGRSTGAHLDWRVRRGGEFVNPRLFL